jgi:hypothetical protein
LFFEKRICPAKPLLFRIALLNPARGRVEKTVDFSGNLFVLAAF